LTEIPYIRTTHPHVTLSNIERNTV